MNEITLQEIKKYPKWMTAEEVAEYMRMSITTLRQHLAAGRVHPRCAKKNGTKPRARWRFDRDVVVTEGIIYIEDE